MNKKLKNRLLIIILVLLGMGASFVTLNFIGKPKTDRTSPTVNDSNYDYRTEKAILTKELKDKTGEEIYVFFKERYKNIDQTKIHNLAHWIGTEIYDRSGMKGLLICDESFSYGCYHGFFIKAFEKEGKDLYASGDKYCFGDGTQPLKYGGCIHGLGHGVLYLNGYDFNGLNGALKDCESLASPSSIEGCNNGVFMEYNTRTMQSLDTGEIKLRSLDEKNPLEPCNLLESKYQPTCYFELPAWWAAVYVSNFQKMTQLCETINNHESKISCFGGVGRMVPVANKYQDDKVKDVCLPIKLLEYKSRCIEKSIEVLLGVGKSDSINLCDMLDSTHAKSCREKMSEYYCLISDKCQTKQ